MKKQSCFNGKPFISHNNATNSYCESSIKSSYIDQVKKLSFAPKKKPDEDHHFYQKQEQIEEWLRSQRTYYRPKSESSHSFTTKSSLSRGSTVPRRPSSTTVKEGQVMPPKFPPARLRWGVPLCYFDYCPQKSPREEDEESFSDRGAQTDLKVLKRMRSRESDVLKFGINKAKY